MRKLTSYLLLNSSENRILLKCAKIKGMINHRIISIENVVDNSVKKTVLFSSTTDHTKSPDKNTCIFHSTSTKGSKLHVNKAVIDFSDFEKLDKADLNPKNKFIKDNFLSQINSWDGKSSYCVNTCEEYVLYSLDCELESIFLENND